MHADEISLQFPAWKIPLPALLLAAWAPAWANSLLPGQVFTVEQGHLLGKPGKGTLEILRSNTDFKAIREEGSGVKTLAGRVFVGH